MFFNPLQQRPLPSARKLWQLRLRPHVAVMCIRPSVRVSLRGAGEVVVVRTEEHVPVGAARDLPQREVRDCNRIYERRAVSTFLYRPDLSAPPALLRRISCFSPSRWASLSSSSSAVGSPSDEELMTHRTPTGRSNVQSTE